MPTKNIADVDWATYAATWNAVSCGWLFKLDATQLKYKTLEVTIGELGPVVLDRAIIGFEGQITLELEQPKLASMRQMIPGAPVSGSIPLIPADRYTKMYQYANLLTLHPDGFADETNDINLLKACPLFSLPTWGGDQKRKIATPFDIYPDQTVIAADGTLVYGYIGAIPE